MASAPGPGGGVWIAVEASLAGGYGCAPPVPAGPSNSPAAGPSARAATTPAKSKAIVPKAMIAQRQGITALSFAITENGVQPINSLSSADADALDAFPAAARLA